MSIQSHDAEVCVYMLISRVCSQYCQDPRTESDCISNTREFLRGCSSLKVEVSSSVYAQVSRTNVTVFSTWPDLSL